MKNFLWIIVLFALMAGCVTPPPARQDHRTLLAFADLANEIRVVRKRPGDEQPGGAVRKEKVEGPVEAL